MEEINDEDDDSFYLLDDDMMDIAMSSVLTMMMMIIPMIVMMTINLGWPSGYGQDTPDIINEAAPASNPDNGHFGNQDNDPSVAMGSTDLGESPSIVDTDSHESDEISVMEPSENTGVGVESGNTGVVLM